MARALGDIAGEGILLAGAARAILLQVADPAVAQGVADHSNFAEDPLSRLNGTLTYVYTVVFGDEDDRAFIRGRVGQAHAPVHSDSYSAIDPSLQLWVAATLYDTTRLVWEKIFGPLDDASADRVYREFAVVGTTLQLPLESWPADRQAFDAYWRGRLAEVTVTRAARLVASDLLHPRVAPWWLRMLLPQVRLVTAGLLPPQLATSYGLLLSARGRARFERWMRRARLIYPHLPVRVRLAARNHYLSRLAADRRQAAADRITASRWAQS